ncbi:MAG: hypothetical protein SF123_20440 [Chloroflexota bacterium]|nr:hypothetical protein [Chloroflexota bacterium]
MAVISAPMTGAAPATSTQSLWLRNRNWDLLFITLSVILVPLPYVFYVLGKQFGLDSDTSRNIVNGFVAIAVGGPHMMSTMLRTGLDGDFRKRYPMLIRSSIIIPIIVISLAMLNLTLLLTVFFFWAATHVLHQVTYIVELYNHKEHKFVRPGSAVSLPSRLIDYAIILTCLFPLASYKISMDNFWIGANDLGMVIPEFFKHPWFFWAVTSVFAVALLAFIIKSIREYRGGYLNIPKTVFIVLTVVVSFSIPALPNMDTAFQGMNTWHSFQYLAITFYIIKIRQTYGDLKDAPLVNRFAKSTKDSKGLFLLSTMMLVGSVVVFILVRILVGIVRPDLPPEQAHQYFDIPYYTAILSFLWIHYYHDHFLFTNFEALDKAYSGSEPVRG